MIMPALSCPLRLQGVSMSTYIHTARADGVLCVTFDRPDKKNALNGSMYRALIAALTAAQEDQETGVVVFNSSGADFTAGNDLADFKDFLQSHETFPALSFVRALAAFPKPMISAVCGDVIGIGVTMLFHCDLVYASPDAIFKMPFIDLGLVPEAGASLLAPMRMGMARAAQALLLGEAFTATEAVAMGLVNALAPHETLNERAYKAACALAAKPRQALLESRRLMRGDPDALLARIDLEAELFAKALTTTETKLRLQALLSHMKDR